MNGFERFNECQLPPKEKFYNSLNDHHITDEDYIHAQLVYNQFNCRNLGDYHDLYLLTDALLLADVFESFCDTCLHNYHLDPGHFYTSPGLAWQAALKMTKTTFDLVTDNDMHLMIEQSIRGGVAMIANRHATANNPLVGNYDPNKEKEYIICLDANSLYGWAMSQHLPVGNFKWIYDTEDFNVMLVPDDNSQGYILEVSLGVCVCVYFLF